MKESANFVGEDELRGMCERHGDTPDLVQAVIDAKLAVKDDACRYWADSMNVAYVDPLVSVITDEAIEKIPLEVAKKTKAIGLYIFNGVMTVAMASPDDQETVKRLGQIARIPVEPGLRAARRSRTRSRSTTPTRSAWRTAWGSSSAPPCSTSPSWRPTSSPCSPRTTRWCRSWTRSCTTG